MSASSAPFQIVPYEPPSARGHLGSSGEAFGEERISLARRSAVSAEAIAEDLLKEAAAWRGTACDDDLTLVVAEIARDFCPPLP